jgi:hypothetical protein
MTLRSQSDEDSTDRLRLFYSGQAGVNIILKGALSPGAMAKVYYSTKAVFKRQLVMQWARAISNKILKVFNFDFLARHNMTTGEPVRTPKLVKIGIVENVSITDSLSATKGVYFELTEPVIIPGLKGDSGGIKLVFDEEDKD